MANQISGYKVYRSTDMTVNKANRRTLAQKKMYEMYWSHSPLYGNRYRRILTMPVPMLTANHLLKTREISLVSHCGYSIGLYFCPVYTHDGVKFRTILRQPTFSLHAPPVWFVREHGCRAGSVPLPEDVVVVEAWDSMARLIHNGEVFGRQVVAACRFNC
jgi:hypothetical protein